jgi:hypothetical protein
MRLLADWRSWRHFEISKRLQYMPSQWTVPQVSISEERDLPAIYPRCIQQLS